MPQKKTNESQEGNGEKASQRNEQLLWLFVEHCPAAVAIFDRDMKYIATSRRFLTDYNLGDRNIIGCSHDEVFPGLPERWREIYRRCLTGAVERCEEDRFLRADGRIDWVNWEIRPWYETQGDIGGVILFSEVITKRKEAEDKLRQSEEKFRSFFCNTAVAVSLVDKEGYIIYSNEADCSFLGYSGEELVGMHLSQFTHPEDVNLDKEMYESLTRGERSSYTIEKRYVREDGEVVWGRLLVSAVRDAEGSLLYTVVVCEDITRRKKTEQALQNQIALMESMLEAIPAPVFFKNTDQVYRGCNKAFSEFVGLPKEEIIDKSVFEVASGELAEVYKGQDEALLRNAGVQVYDSPVKAQDGTLREVMFHKATYSESSGKVAGLIGVMLDISKSKRAEDALKESERRLFTLMSSLPGMAYRCVNCPDWSMEFISEGCSELTGYSSEDLVNDRIVSYGNLIHPEDRRRVWDQIQESLALNQMFEIEYRIRTRAGKEKWMWERGVGIPSEGTNPLKLEGFITDITERTMTEKYLRESEERYRILVEMSPDGIAVHQEGKLVFANPAAVKMLGARSRDELIGKPIREIVHPDYWEGAESRIKRMMAGETGLYPVEDCYIRTDGTPFSVEVTALPLTYDAKPAVQVVVRDITERKQADQSLAETSRRLRLAVEAANVGIWDWNLETNGVYYSSEWKSQIGCDDHEISSELSEWESRVHPDDLEKVLKRVHDYLENPWPDYVNEFRLRHKDGSYRCIMAQASLMSNDKGKPVRMLGCHLDITERIEAEEILREREHLLREMSRIAKIGAWEFDTTSREGTWTEEVARIHETDPEFTINVDSGLSFYHGNSRRMIESAIEQAVDEGKSFDLKLDLLTAKNNRKWVRTIGHTVKQGDRITGIRGTVQDVTDQVVMEQSLLASEKQYRTLFEQSAEGILIVLHEGEIIDANPACSRLFGVPRHELVGGNVLEFYADPADRTAFRQVVNREDSVKDFEMQLRRRDGELRNCLLNSSVWRDDSGTPIGYLSIIRDITKQERSRVAQLRLATAIDQSAESVVITDADGIIQYANPAFEKITGYSRDEAIGTHPRFLRGDLEDESVHERLEDAFRNGETWKGRFIGKRKDGKLFTEDTTISPVRDSSGKVTNFVKLGHDVSDRLKLEKQLFQAQKMESIGTLAGGLAHDFNNLLTIISGYAEIALMGKMEGDPGLDELSIILRTAGRGAELVQQILTFSREVETRPRPTNLNSHMEQAKKLLYKTIPKMIEIKTHLAEDLKIVMVDPSQIEQILINLGVNARDAMPEGGQLIFRTENRVLDENDCQLHPDVEPGEYVVMTISDTGHGMEKDVLQRIFEPFFSTKKPGKGTGLGLAMVFGIVKSHNGHVTCHSEPGEGTAFEIYFPVMKEEREEFDVSASGIMPALGSETILLVDDEALIRNLGTRILESAGYAVLTASDGHEALELYDRERARISLVLLDLIMPEMGGKRCLKELMKINPHLRVIISSGFSADLKTKDVLESGARGFVDKPFKIQEILRTVRKVLDD
jgi:two-component system cell cycle sensor histidine kinase/response regulator CckA